MKRRQFLGLLGGAAAWPLAVQAQGAMATIGILSGTNREPRLIDAVLAGLQQAGYAEGATWRSSIASPKATSTG